MGVKTLKHGVHLLLLPGMDGTGRLFDPLVRALGSPLTVVAFPSDRALGYEELLPIVETAAAGKGDFVVIAESFSGPLAAMLARKKPLGLRGVVLCASFVRCPVPRLRWLRTLVWPCWFWWTPKRLMHHFLLGRHGSADLRRLVDAAIGEVSPVVMAARVRAMLEVDVASELGSCVFTIFMS
jgi:sigma-B regulation protein RsbQ